MKVYVIVQEWSNGDEHQIDNIGVYSSEEKVQEKIKELYEEDVKWIKEEYSLENTDDFEECVLLPLKSYVAYDEFYSDNYTEIFELQ